MRILPQITMLDHTLNEEFMELPVEFKVTKASNSENTEAKNMLKIMDEKKLETCKYLLANKGYDDTKIIRENILLTIFPKIC